MNFKINLDRCPKERGGGALSGGVLVKVIYGFKLSQYDDVLRIQLFNASSIAMDLTSKLDLNVLALSLLECKFILNLHLYLKQDVNVILFRCNYHQ